MKQKQNPKTKFSKKPKISKGKWFNLEYPLKKQPNKKTIHNKRIKNIKNY